jgi:hypothetical protein
MVCGLDTFFDWVLVLELTKAECSVFYKCDWVSKIGVHPTGQTQNMKKGSDAFVGAGSHQPSTMSSCAAFHN